jgi:hypothetical protein
MFAGWTTFGVLAQAAAQVPVQVQPQDALRSPFVFVARRGWHIDIGFAASDLEPPLSSLATEFPGVRYLFFGFGDRQYLLAKNHNAPVLWGALWPGRGILLITGLSKRPNEAFGATHVAALPVTRQQLHDTQAFVWNSLERQGATHSSARGPYDGSLYFSATPRYSAFHTCNTWAAEALKAAALPIHSAGVLFAGQLWTQVRRAERDSTQRCRCQCLPHRFTRYRVAWCRPGKRPSSPNSAARPPWCSSPAAGDCCC